MWLKHGCLCKKCLGCNQLNDTENSMKVFSCENFADCENRSKDNEKRV